MILAVNCAEELLQVVLGAGGQIAACLELDNCGKMNGVLAPAVAGMLAQAGVRPAELSMVACVRGPGGFTGVRSGLAFCHGLCLAAGVPLAGLDYLPLLAANALAGLEGRESAGELHVLTYSRRAKVYHQAFTFGVPSEGSPVPSRNPLLGAPLGPPLDLPVDQALALVNVRAANAGTTRLLAVGSGLLRNPEVFETLAPQFERLPHSTPSPKALLHAASTTPASGPPVDVLYLRGSDAEENFLEFAALRGLDAEEAQRRMKNALE